ncbi:hypothetical protein BH11MYX1_BH11MYX1_49560 [soil metagenome]
MWSGLVVGLLVVGVGCTRTWEREAVQPNPLVHPAETLRTSEKITIVTGDMDLDQPAPAVDNPTSLNASAAHSQHYPLVNQASFTMVSRDRLRFHVQIDHKWEDYADLKNWQVELSDSEGHQYSPEAVEHVRSRLMTTMWDREQRSQVCDGLGRAADGNCLNTIGFANDGWRRRQTLGSLSVFRGNADFVFYKRDLFTRNLQWVKLTLKHSNAVFEFRWRFQDDVASVGGASPGDE